MDISIDDRKELYSSLLDQVTRSDSETDLDEIKRNICGLSDETKVNLKKISDDLLAEKDTLILAKIIRLVAELGKEEQCRQALVAYSLFDSLAQLFKNSKLDDLVKTQLCRAIGNMCYHNDQGRIKYLEACGFEPLFDVCKYATSLDLSDVSKGQTDDRVTLLTVALGCLHNITNDNETLKNAAYENNVMSVLKLFIPFISKSQGIGMYFASCIESLIELDEGKSLFVKEKLALELYKNLTEEILDDLNDYQDDFFDMLNEINELEKSKDYLCETDFLRVLVSKIETKLDDEEFLRGSCLFIVNLLVRDDALTVFNYGQDFLINKSIEWLSKYKNIQLYVTSAVIIANYMRSDENSLKMINHELKPHVLILETLNELYKESPSLQEINVVHSFLGAMRNFCVNVKTREEILKYNTIETSLRFLSYENLEVKFKALAIIRLLIKNCNESNGLGLVFEQDNLSTIGKIALNPQDHPGIAGESSRLVCYLPVAAKSEKNINKFCQANVISVICDQLKSQHLIMINEALLALNVLTVINYRAAHEQFKSGELSQRILDMYEKAKLPVEMMINSLKLFKILMDKNDFFTESELKSYLERFKKMKLDENPDFIKSQIDQLINSIENEIA